MMKFKVVFAFIILLMSGCATSSKPKLMPVEQDKGPVILKFAPQVGYKDVSEYKSRSVTKTYSSGEIVRKLTEGVDYTVEVNVLSADKKRGTITYKTTTIEKDGKLDLADFAMPELGESIEYTINEFGEILKAGDFFIGTIYYLPPVSFPKNAVSVGDTWSLNEDWISSKSGMPLRIDLVSILTNLRDCGLAGKCAEVEVSGGVSIKGVPVTPISSQTLDDKKVNLRFKSEIKGKIILSIESGIVLYSIVRADEQISSKDSHVDISSCTISYVREPASHKILSTNNVECDPVGNLPSL